MSYAAMKISRVAAIFLGNNNDDYLVAVTFDMISACNDLALNKEIRAIIEFENLHLSLPSRMNTVAIGELFESIKNFMRRWTTILINNIAIGNNAVILM